MEETSTVTTKGQITIPKAIRSKLDLSEGRKIKFEVRGARVILTPEIDDPIDELKTLRDDIAFSNEEIQRMMNESKEKWSQLKE